MLILPVQMTATRARRICNRPPGATTGATPLAIIKEGLKTGNLVPPRIRSLRPPRCLWVIWWFNVVAAIALLIGFVYLLYKSYNLACTRLDGSIAIFTAILWLVNPEQNANPMFHILAGGVLLGAIFMATDYVTSPMIPKSMIIYGCGIGIITVIIRVFGAYPEGVSFAILIMNAFVPLLNANIKPKRFGEEVING
jgi:electron transport complex protein RnfD